VQTTDKTFAKDGDVLVGRTSCYSRLSVQRWSVAKPITIVTYVANSRMPIRNRLLERAECQSLLIQSDTTPPVIIWGSLTSYLIYTRRKMRRIMSPTVIGLFLFRF